MTQEILAPVDRRYFLIGLLGASLGGCAHAIASADGAELAEPRGDVAPVHDPCIIRADGLYHVFSTGQEDNEHGLVAWRTSPDLGRWTWRGAVFDAIPAWAQTAIPGTRGIWAPDISYFRGRYHLYYSVSTFGSNRSAIGLATAQSLDPARPSAGWQDHGPVLESHPDDDYNAIDANHLEDADGRHWLAVGSFWSGIKLFELDPATEGSRTARRKHSLARRPVPERAPGAIEAPFLIERDA